MTDRLLLAVALVLVAVAVAFVLQRRRPAAPTQSRVAPVPVQLDRADFPAPEKHWLVAVFTSETCESCARATERAAVLQSDQVAYAEASYQEHRDLHDRYGIAIVPTTVIADRDGVVQASFVGVPTATDLWAAVAEAREPGSTPEPE